MRIFRQLFVFLLSCFPFLLQAQQEINSLTWKYGQFLYALSNSYVDSINAAELTENAISKVLSELDPHSSYTSAKEAKSANEFLQGNFEGIGIEFNIMNDTLLVINPVAGGPSQKIGILAGDRILEVDGKNIAVKGLNTNDIVKMLRGAKGSQVAVTVLRRGVSELLDFVITRDKIPIHSISASFWAAPNIAYINIGHFSLTTHKEFVDAMKKLGKVPEGLILDLRGNTGGILESAVAIADEFLPKGSLIVYTEGRAIKRVNAVASDSLRMFEKGKLIVLLDENSASASEIVAGAVQDWDRGLLLGCRTFGKGLVQSQSELLDGSLIRITVARYHTPTGRVIQRSYTKGKAQQYYESFYKRYARGELFNADSISLPDSLKFFTLKNKRIVYGGGGIMPDIFIPLDTTHSSAYYSKLIRMGIIHRFAMQYTDQNRKLLQVKYPDSKDFNKKFILSDTDFEALINFAESQKLPKDEQNIAKSKTDIMIRLKGLIAQDLFGLSAYYEAVFPLADNNYRKALETMKNWKESEKLLLPRTK